MLRCHGGVPTGVILQMGWWLDAFFLAGQIIAGILNLGYVAERRATRLCQIPAVPGQSGLGTGKMASPLGLGRECSKGKGPHGVGLNIRSPHEDLECICVSIASKGFDSLQGVQRQYCPGFKGGAPVHVDRR